MADAPSTILEALFGRRGIRGFIVALLVSIFVVMFLIGFEAYTGKFALERIEKELVLVEKLRTSSPPLEKAQENQLLEIRQGNIARLLSMSKSSEVGGLLSVQRKYNFLAHVAFFLTMGVVSGLIGPVRRIRPLGWAFGLLHVGSIMVLGTITAPLTMFLPQLWGYWGHGFIYPLIAYLLVNSIFYVSRYHQMRKLSEQAAQEFVNASFARPDSR